ncbi:MAG: bifunctional 4-hydroxy-2-oxoglutarate aldolase/2-dehydro-3-deoxy-phosphogluconate aldolase [Oenococcus sp.]|uniref:bifunctional 4-hydroxy-2-oxoglutarate aldolase/2-dehydro-3-deoxy-phosphogluconate aldolase n=1 Tax=Oenococcus TaxID=46254 RepID=UPI0021E7B5CE|nr:bifunctional 4-hydroxy-2-oxoglutarate aldolase/2-dehydro-3-deoxy-phosphogluconate aldolase [Oenococcus kitaharae]MCV3295517.1 bifunctional 4-hydroxy-2-oxoglutarate aldolase/2-dehydro-3-deoxy-phosphogluconate aldolase [Oenococcus kitaharae]
MQIDEYPIFTIIMRGYSKEQADSIMQAMSGYEKYFAVEVTMNTNHAIEIIKEGQAKFGNRIHIGAGTVLHLGEAKQALDAGAEFLLGPMAFTKTIIDLAHQKNALAIPAAMTPSETMRMFDSGADIVKIFPATTVGPDFFKSIQAPLGDLRLMAVGGVSSRNAQEFLSHSTKYLGIGSNMFNREDLLTNNITGLSESLASFVATLKTYGEVVSRN